MALEGSAFPAGVGEGHESSLPPGAKPEDPAFRSAAPAQTLGSPGTRSVLLRPQQGPSWLPGRGRPPTLPEMGRCACPQGALGTQPSLGVRRRDAAGGGRAGARATAPHSPFPGPGSHPRDWPWDRGLGLREGQRGVTHTPPVGGRGTPCRVNP